MTSSSRPASLSPRQKANVSSGREGEAQRAEVRTGPHHRLLATGGATTCREDTPALPLPPLSWPRQGLGSAGRRQPRSTDPPSTRTPPWAACLSQGPRPRPPPRRSPQEGPAPPMAVLQSPGSSQVSMVMVAGDPFTATGMTVGEPRSRAPPSASPKRQLRVCPWRRLHEHMQCSHDSLPRILKLF